MNELEFAEKISGYNFETFLNAIKTSPFYRIYKKCVEMSPKGAEKALEALALGHAGKDREFDLHMTKVSLDLLFMFADMRLQQELSGKEGSENASVQDV